MKPSLSSIPLAIAASVALAACGGAPSESDIKAAIEKEMTAGKQAMQQFAGAQGAAMFQSMVPEIKSIKKLGCKGDGDNAYRCDVEMEVAQSGSTGKGVTSIRFVKGSDGWMAQK